MVIRSVRGILIALAITAALLISAQFSGARFGGAGPADNAETADEVTAGPALRAFWQAPQHGTSDSSRGPHHDLMQLLAMNGIVGATLARTAVFGPDAG